MESHERIKKALETGKKVRALRDAGYSIEEIGTLFGVPEDKLSDFEKVISKYDELESVKSKHSKEVEA